MIFSRSYTYPQMVIHSGSLSGKAQRTSFQQVCDLVLEAEYLLIRAENTVYTLWKRPDLLSFLSTPAPVVPKLIGGADLMIPGGTPPPGSPHTFELISDVLRSS